MGFRSRGKSCRFFMSDMNPLDLVRRADRVRNAIQRVAGDAVDPLHAGVGKNLHQQIRYFLLGQI
jgi:hypothetical protein